MFGEIYDISRRAPFEIKATEAMHYRRHQAQMVKGEGRPFRSAGVSDGRGVVFVSHTGEAFPSGFLEGSVAAIAKEDPQGL